MPTKSEKSWLKSDLLGSSFTRSSLIILSGDGEV